MKVEDQALIISRREQDYPGKYCKAPVRSFKNE